jgi:hypothetical protein
MPKWLKQWIIWNAPENRIQRGSKARLFDILWKMWWSSRVTITMQSFLHPCPYAWTTVGTRCKLGPQSWTGMTRCKSTHVRGFFSSSIYRFLSMCWNHLICIWYLFCWAHLSQTAWQITTAQATIITHNYLTNQLCNFILKITEVSSNWCNSCRSYIPVWMEISDLRLRRFSSRRFP